MKYTKELLESAVKASVSYYGVLRFLGIRQTGGSNCHIKRKVIQYGISTSHFTGQAHNKGKVSNRRLSANNILILRSNGRRQSAQRLRRALLEIGREYVCERCGNNGEWFGDKLVLQVDHKNGDWQDDRSENLRFLCPHCHQQTSNYGNKGCVAQRQRQHV